MFCTNCGAQNADNATTCQKCGFKLKEEVAAASKFKGTMLMMNAPPELQQLRQNVQGAAAPAAAVPPAAAAPVATPPTAAMPAGAGPTGTAAMPKQSFKGTMLGVAPPSLAGLVQGNAPAGGAGVNISQVPSTAAASPAAMSAQVAPPVSPVNPLGGTMVAYGVPEAARQHIAEIAAQANLPAVGAANPAGPAGLASTMPSSGAGGFASTTPSAGTAPPNFAAMATPPVVRVMSTPQSGSVVSSSAPRPAFLIALIVVLVIALAALCWSMFKTL